jgi:branched-chain amino acid transport system substrate-binding protein
MFSKLSKRSVVFLIIALVGVLALAACGGAEEEEAVKVGAIFDLTGPTSDVGTPYSEGLTDFVNWYNEGGGVDGQPLELLSADYAYAVDQAEQLYSQYVDEGAVVFMGWGTGDTEALRGRIADDEIPFMSASYSDVLGEGAARPHRRRRNPVHVRLLLGCAGRSTL